MLEQLATLKLDMQLQYALPLVPGGYIGRNLNGTILTKPAFNLTIEQKERYGLCFVYQLYKLGHNYKTWKQRTVQLINNKLLYYDSKTGFKNEFSLENCSVEVLEPSTLKLSADVYPFRLSNYNNGGEFMECYVTSNELRQMITTITTTKVSGLAIIKDLSDHPNLLTGWLKKQGHVVKNWKSRFFVLNNSVLKYYDKDGQKKSSGSAVEPKGEVDLKGNCNFVIIVATVLYLYHSSYLYS